MTNQYLQQSVFTYCLEKVYTNTKIPKESQKLEIFEPLNEPLSEPLNLKLQLQSMKALKQFSVPK